MVSTRSSAGRLGGEASPLLVEEAGVSAKAHGSIFGATPRRALAAIARLLDDASSSAFYSREARRWRDALDALWSAQLQFFVTRTLPPAAGFWFCAGAAAAARASARAMKERERSTTVYLGLRERRGRGVYALGVSMRQDLADARAEDVAPM